MKRYTLAVTSPEYWSEIHHALIIDSNQDGIPDRKITCSDCKDHSPTRGTYELTEAEATEIGNHPHVKWIELSPEDNPGHYPNPILLTKRFPKDVRIYRTLSGSNAPPSSPTIAEENRTNWAVPRVGVDTNGDAWPNDTLTIDVKTGNVDFSLTGKNVDVIIMDSGVLAAHPEFLDANGKSRVLDVILDGPYLIDPAYFNSNSLTYTRPDGRIGITTTSAHAWWENSSSRSGSFSSVGTVAIPSSYTEPNALGVGGTIHSMTSTHGTRCASLACGKNFGLAFESNIWNMSIFAPANQSVSGAYDCIKIFHQNKPTNSVTGIKNPTLVNGSWGYNGAMTSSGTVNYKFAGNTGSFVGNASFAAGDNSPANLVKAMKEGFLTFTGAYKAWATSSRSNSTETAGNEMMSAGIIHVCAAGNDNQRLGIGADDPHRLDYLSDTYYSSTDPRSEFPSGTVPCGHRDFMHPQGIGFDSATDFHPTICVGAMDDLVYTNYTESPTFYSNNGPGIDVWAPADDTLAAGMKSSTGDDLGSSPTYYNRYNSDFVDQYMNGTSAASPVCAGLVALHLESVPGATSREVKRFLDEQGSVHVGNDLFETVDPNTGIGTTSYWFNSYNLRGAKRRILRDKSASPTVPSISISSDNIISQNLVCHLDAGNFNSYSGSGTTWSDISGSGNNFTINGATFISSGSSSYFDFDGTNDFVQGSAFNFGTDSFTIGMWVYLDTFDVLNDVFFATHDTTAVSNFSTNSFEVRRNGNNSSNGYPRWEHRMQLGGVKFEVGTGAAGEKGHFTGGRWHYYVCTFENSSSNPYGTVKLYLNSSLIVSGSSAAANGGQHNFTQNDVVYLGKNRPSVRYMDGRIAQLHVYKGSILTASEVRHNYDAMKSRYLDDTLSFSGFSFKQS